MNKLHSLKIKIVLTYFAMTGCVATMPSEDLGQLIRGETFDRIGEYRIGSADNLIIRVFGEDSLSGQYVVTPSGTVQLPLVGFVKAAGLTQVQLARHIETALRPFVREPRVAVSLADSQSYRVFFSGEVQSRGARELKARTSLLEGVIMAGGLTEYATGRIFLIRRLNDRQVKRYETSFKDLLSGRKATDSIYLERGDIIHAE